MARVHHARLNTTDAENLFACLARLNAIHDSVQATGMAGKLAIMEHCVGVYRAIEAVLAKEFAAVARSKGEESAERPQEAQAGSRGAASSSEGRKTDTGEEGT